ncbi:MAG: MMPL family transporter [Actinomycetota bacterium]|nr:MMPL family transporter [Actinomycetota bacterium]
MRPKGLFGWLGWFLVRFRYVVVLFWAGAALVAYLYLPPLAGNTTGSLSDLVPESAPAAQAEQVGGAPHLTGPVEPPAILVYSNPQGFTRADVREMRAGLRYLNGPWQPYRLDRAVPLAIRNEEDPTRIGSGLLGQRVLPVLLSFETGSSPTGISTGVRETKEALSQGTLDAEVTGVLPVQADTNDLIQGNLELVTVVTALAIFLIVALTYRSLVAPLIPLASIGLSAFLTLRILGWLAVEKGITVPSQVEPIIVVLLFGVGTDYALFLLSRTRQALGEGARRTEAALVAVERVGGVLFSSAAVLVVAFMLLVFAQLGLYRALGPGLAFALLLVFVVTLTLVPALLAILGSLAFGRTALVPRTSSVYVSLLRRPGLVAGVLIIVFTVAASGTHFLRVGFDLLANLPDSAPATRGYEDLTREFPGGLLSPVNVVIEGEDLDDKQDALLRLQQEMQTELLRSGELATAVLGPQYDGQISGIDFITRDGSAARVLLVVYGAPYSPTALDQAGQLQQELPALLDRAGLEDATGVVGGQTALAAAARDTSEADLKRLAPMVFGAVFVVLALLLRTPVAPLYLLGATALSLAATIGVSTLLFQNVLGHGGVVYYVPFALFLLLVALGSDYNIFIMAAIREEAETKPLREAVTAALANTGPTISAAGVVLAGSFFLLTLIPLRDFFQIGVAMAIGILLDAFVIRTLLVPSLALLAGPRGFWPRKVKP